MKKLLIIFTVITLIALSVVSVTAESHFDIQISEDGKGSATYFYDFEKGIVSMGVEETDEPFIYWDIKGDYEIIKTENEGRIYHVKPHSNLDITAVFESALYQYDEATPDMTSPQTGDNRLYGLILTFMLGVAVGAFAIWKITRKD